jgi:hypothetical protein
VQKYNRTRPNDVITLFANAMVWRACGKRLKHKQKFNVAFGNAINHIIPNMTQNAFLQMEQVFKNL